MGSKTGGNTEPMPFVRKWGSAATGGGPEEQQQQHDGSAPPPPGTYDPLANEYAGPAPPPPEPETPSSSSRKRDRSRSRDRKKDRKRDRSRSRDRRRRSRSRDKRSKRSRSRSRERRRSRSRDRRSRSRSPRDRKKEKSPEFQPPAPAPAPIIREPIINPLLRAEVVAEITGTAPAPEIADQAMALVPTQPRKKERKSRWSEHKSFVPGMPTILPADLPDDQRIAYLLQMEIEDATRKLRLGDFAGPADPAQRSPSPEPIYDANGKRLNTRDVRKRQEMEQFRHEKIQQLMKVNPNYRPPTDYRAPNIKLHDKVWIPQEAHPELNFVGLLIGPRGNTLKSLETETGAKIIIRGKGSIKEGKLANRMGPMPGENEPLHAYVTAGDQATIKKACDRIRQIIAEATCIPDGQNALRQLQLRELALLNGTFRPEDLLNSTRCSNCGSDEHKSWECPEAPNVTANIICTACGCAGHIARDCKNPRPGGVAADMGMPDFASMDSEYSALMEELGEKPKVAPMPVDPKTQPQPFQLPGTGKGPGGYNNRGGPGGFNPFDNRGGFNPFEQHRQQAAAYAAQSSAAYDQTPAGFYASPGAQRGNKNPYAAGGWYGQTGGAPMPVPVPPPPPPMGGFPPPPPPPPPVPAADLSRLLSAAPPPPPPQ